MAGRPRKFREGSMGSYHLRLPLSLIESLRAIARAEERDLQDVVRRALRQYAEHKTKN